MARCQFKRQKIKAIQQYVRPVTKKSMRAFSGLVNFYRRFIPNQATIVAPLTDATRKESPDKINWTRPLRKSKRYWWHNQF